MIRELSVKNLALIEDLRVTFRDGFTVFTGETGAGKSILIGAIGLLLGDRASSEMVRSGSEEAEVTGIFELSWVSERLSDLLDRADIALEDDQLIVRRVISLTGRNRVQLNSTPVPLSLLKEIGDRLVDFHSQHEHQSLLRPEAAYDIVNGLPGVTGTLAEYRSAFGKLEEKQAELNRHIKQAEELRQRRDFLEFQHHEISSLNLKAGEEETLEKELKLLSSSAERAECAAGIVGILSEGPQAVNRSISQIRKKLETLARYDASAQAWMNDIENASQTFSELETFCGSYAGALEQSDAPVRIEKINSRLAAIQKTKRKYNASVEDLLQKQKDLENALSSIENATADRNLLEKETASARTKTEEKGLLLRKARETACKSFDSAISKQMAKLGFQGGSWKTALRPLESPTAQGLEELEFLVRTNPGEPFLPLAKTASGGEISRLMLAIKTVVSGHDRVPVLIFDEVDTGIGGVLAREVANALVALSQKHQVISISHLHQIASQANHHYSVYKHAKHNRTVTEIKRLSHEEKIQEIARMLGGDSEITRKHAEQLLQQK